MSRKVLLLDDSMKAPRPLEDLFPFAEANWAELPTVSLRECQFRLLFCPLAHGKNMRNNILLKLIPFKAQQGKIEHILNYGPHWPLRPHTHQSPSR